MTTCTTARPMRKSCRHWRRHRTGWLRISDPGKRRGARSIASSASTTTSRRISRMPTPSIPVPFTSGQWGLARLVRRAADTRARSAALWQQRQQQLRRGGRVRRKGEGDGTGDGRRRERRPEVAALQRPGQALRGGLARSGKSGSISEQLTGQFRPTVPSSEATRGHEQACKGQNAARPFGRGAGSLSREREELTSCSSRPAWRRRQARRQTPPGLRVIIAFIIIFRTRFPARSCRCRRHGWRRSSRSDPARRAGWRTGSHGSSSFWTLPSRLLSSMPIRRV